MRLKAGKRLAWSATASLISIFLACRKLPGARCAPSISAHPRTYANATPLTWVYKLRSNTPQSIEPSAASPVSAHIPHFTPHQPCFLNPPSWDPLFLTPTAPPLTPPGPPLPCHFSQPLSLGSPDLDLLLPWESLCLWSQVEWWPASPRSSKSPVSCAPPQISCRWMPGLLPWLPSFLCGWVHWTSVP